jgi:hypothetical protein
MRRLDKSTLALTFKFDCDRFLRLRLATPEEQRRLDIEADRYKRPGIQLITAAGRRWEADKSNPAMTSFPPVCTEADLTNRRREAVERRFDRLQPFVYYLVVS